MLHQFLAIFLITIVSLVAILIFKVVLPLWRFMVRANYVIEFYPLFIPFLKKGFAIKGNKITIKFVDIAYKKELKFSNTNEASIEFEKLIKEALEYYDKIEWMATLDTSLNALQKELIKICSEVRMMRWQNQKQ